MDRVIPERLEDLTPEWLTGALRGGGHLSPSGTVVSVEQEILGEGEGFMGTIARLRLSYEGGEGPASVVAKMPKLENRAFGELVGVYERESCFYEEFSGLVPVSLPLLYFSDFDRTAVSDRQKRTTSLANRIPGRLMPRVIRVALWSAGRREAALPPADGGPGRRRTGRSARGRGCGGLRGRPQVDREAARRLLAEPLA